MKWIKTFSALFCILFIILYLFAGYSLQATPDEMSMVIILRKYGFIGSYFNFSSYFNVRVSALFLLDGFLYFMQTPLSYRIGSVIIFVSLLFINFLAVKKILRNLNAKADDFNVSIGSVLLFAGFYFSCPSSIEVFCWLSGIFTYLMSFIFLIFGWSYLSSKKINSLQWLIMLFSFAVVGGAVENLALFTLLLLFCNCAASIKEKEKEKLYRNAAAFMVCAVFFILGKSFLGVENKLYVLKKLPEAYAHFGGDRSTNDFWLTDFNFVETRNLFSFLFIIPFLLTNPFGFEEEVKAKIKKTVLKLSLFTVLFLIINFLMAIKIFDSVGSGRFWSPVYFFMFLSVILFSVYISIQFQIKNIKLYAVFSLLGSCVLLLYYDVRKITALHHYNTAFENIYSEMEKAKLRSDTILEIDQLPPPGIIVETVITKDPEHFFNTCFAEYHQVNYKIKLKDTNK